MTPSQIELGRHALGLPNKRRTSYRNHFVAGADHPDHENWVEMVMNGCAERRVGSVLSGGDDVFVLTRSGASRCLKAKEKLSADDFEPKCSITECGNDAEKRVRAKLFPDQKPVELMLCGAHFKVVTEGDEKEPALTIGIHVGYGLAKAEEIK